MLTENVKFRVLAKVPQGGGFVPVNESELTGSEPYYGYLSRVMRREERQLTPTHDEQSPSHRLLIGVSVLDEDPVREGSLIHVLELSEAGIWVDTENLLLYRVVSYTRLAGFRLLEMFLTEVG